MILYFVILSFSMLATDRTNPKDQPVELGKVSWYRDFDQAIALSKSEDKPILILFQEVPGCATCRNYGTNVLSHPLLVDAIENEFIPLAIFNNKGGADRKILEKYNEPTWNNPVVRIVDRKGENLVNRLAGNYSNFGLVFSMKQALIEAQNQVPEYLQLLVDEFGADSRSTKEKYYKMYCFWSGEGHLGNQSGVIKTAPGFMNGHEVVQVIYDESVVTEKTLNNYAALANCSEIEGQNFRIDKDPQYYLKNSLFRYLPLNSIQKTKINSNLGKGMDAAIFLSPTQKAWLLKIEKMDRKKLTSLYEDDLEDSWFALAKNMLITTP